MLWMMGTFRSHLCLTAKLVEEKCIQNTTKGYTVRSIDYLTLEEEIKRTGRMPGFSVRLTVAQSRWFKSTR